MAAFLALVGRPHCRPNGAPFYSLIELWPFVKWKHFQRSRKNRAQWTPKISPAAVTGEVWCDLLAHKMPSGTRSVIKRAKTLLPRQRDGARIDSMRSIREKIDLKLKEDGFEINLERRPSNLLNFEVLHIDSPAHCRKRASAIKDGANLQR